MFSPIVVNGAPPLPPPGNLGKASTLATPREEELREREKTASPRRKKSVAFCTYSFSMAISFYNTWSQSFHFICLDPRSR
jgi:hypothetical protein